MFWKKLILINIIVCYLALKIFLLLSTHLNKTGTSQREKNKDIESQLYSIGSYKLNSKQINCEIGNIFEFNEELVRKFDKLRSTLFFKIFKVNFDSSCNFWTQNMICNFHTCSVCQCDDNEIPLPWMQDSDNDDVDKKIEEKFHKWVEKYNYSSPNWIVENEIDSKNGIFVNLEKNPEAFTGYQGQHIWNAIYYENCFKMQSPDQMCREEKTFYKIISGLHSNINIHLSRNYLDLNKNISFYNTTMLNERLLSNPERINNLFFLYSILMKAFYKAEDLVKEYNIYTGDSKQDNLTKSILNEIYQINDTVSDKCLTKQIKDEILGDQVDKYYNTFENFDQNGKFFNFNPLKLDELKMRFRNISEIIDCVSCQKCKLHGKLQIYGLATMLKILFTPFDNEIRLKRNELISFVNLVGKVGRAIQYLKEIPQNKNTEIYTMKSHQDQALDFKLFLLYLVPVSFFLLMMNRHFLNNKKLLENKLSKNKRVKAANNMQSNLLSDEDQIINYLNTVKKDENFILSKKDKKNQ